MKKEIVITRIFDAPVELVWKAWTDPTLVMRWWGPDKFTCPSAKIDFREGGISLVSMRAAKEMGGQEFFSIWAYKKIVPLQSIEFIQSLSDKDGNKVPPTTLGMPGLSGKRSHCSHLQKPSGRQDRNDRCPTRRFWTNVRI